MANAPAVAPGSGTTEYKLAAVANVVAVLLIAAGGALEALPDASRPAWVGVVLVVIGAASKFLTNAGYFKARAQVKTAALLAAGAAKAVADAEGAPASP